MCVEGRGEADNRLHVETVAMATLPASHLSAGKIFEKFPSFIFAFYKKVIAYGAKFEIDTK